QRARPKTVCERRLLAELEHEEAAMVLVGSRVEESYEVRMVERGEGLDLTVEARAVTVLAQDLDRDVALEARVDCAVDVGHAAAREQRGQAVAAGEDGRGRRHDARAPSCTRGRCRPNARAGVPGVTGYETSAGVASVPGSQ